MLMSHDVSRIKMVADIVNNMCYKQDPVPVDIFIPKFPYLYCTSYIILLSSLYAYTPIP